MSGEQDQNRRQADRWLASAERDLVTARFLRQGEFFNTACFNAQQAAEKALKAFLFANGERGVRGHSCVGLLNRCIPIFPELERILPACRALDRHCVLTRYPDALPEESPHEAYGPEDADDAISRAENVLSAVTGALGSGGKGTDS